MYGRRVRRAGWSLSPPFFVQAALRQALVVTADFAASQEESWTPGSHRVDEGLSKFIGKICLTELDTSPCIRHKQRSTQRPKGVNK
jgi:hypothetical protein